MEFDNVGWKFSQEDSDGNHFSASLQLPYDASWNEVMDRFVLFLSAVYGYDISEKMLQETDTPFTQK
jgi:hypothetical protein